MSVSPDPATMERLRKRGSLTVSTEAAGAPRQALGGIPFVPRAFLRRSHLFELLERDHTVTLLRASSGAGKSTLVADWIRSRDGSELVVWMSVDSASASRVGFWNRLSRMLTESGALPENFGLGAGRDATPRRLAELVLDGLRGTPSRVLLVLDDLHLADDSVSDDLMWLMERTEQLHLVCISRRWLPFESPAAIARLEPLVIRQADLALTEEEALEIADLLQLDVIAQDVRDVLDRTGGHPLLTRVALTTVGHARTLPGPVDAAALVAVVTQSAIPSIDSILEDGPRRAVALRLALLPTIDLELAGEMLGSDNPAAVLRDFERDGIGEVRESAGRLYFSFNPTVARVLADIAAAEVAPDEARRVRLSAIARLRDHGDPLDALRIAITLDEEYVVWPVVAHHFSALMTRHPQEVAEVLGALPLERIRRDGGIAAAIAIARSEHELTPSPEVAYLADIAIDYFEADRRHSDPGRRFLALAASIGAVRAARRYEDAAAYTDELIDGVDSLPAAAKEAVGLAVGAVLVQVGVTYILLGRFDDAISVAHRLANDPHPGRREHRLALLGYVHAMRGEMRDATAYVASMSHLEQASWLRTKPASGWHVEQALALLEEGDAPGALSLIAPFDESLRLLEYWPYLAWTKGLIRLAGGEPATGADELEAVVRKLLPRGASGVALDLLTALDADLLLAAGYPDRARRALASPASESPALSLARARLALLSGTGDSALELILSAETSALATPRQQMEAFALHAIQAERLDDHDRAVDATKRMLALSTRNALRLPLMMVPRAEVAPLLAEVAPEHGSLLDGLPDPFGRVLSPGQLTQRELTVLSALAAHSSVKELAGALFVSPNTVKTQLRSIYGKLAATNRAEALAVARRRGIIDR